MAVYQNQNNLGKVFEAHILGVHFLRTSALYAQLSPDRLQVCIPNHPESAAYSEKWESLKSAVQKWRQSSTEPVRLAAIDRICSCDLVRKVNGSYESYPGVETKLTLAGMSALHLLEKTQLQKGDTIKDVYLTRTRPELDLIVKAYDGRIIRAPYTGSLEPGLYDIKLTNLPPQGHFLAEIIAAHKF